MEAIIVNQLQLTKLSRVFKVTVGLFFFTLTNVLADNLPTSHTNHSKDIASPIAYKINNLDAQTIRKIAISYHHALLEVDYKKGYIIADLTTKEIASFKHLGFTPEPALEWDLKYQSFLHKINKSGLAKQKSMTGIPGFECYPTVEESLETGSSLASQYPDLTDWIDIGDSWEKTQSQGGYDLMVLKITNKSIQEDKPKLFVHSSMHAREYAPATLNLDFAQLLLNSYELNADVRWIVDYHEIHLLFHMNPDGRKIAETGILQRKNTNEQHCPQGLDDGTIGVDLNRNFAYSWNATTNGSSGVECDQTYRGLAAESEPETKAVSDYIRGLFPDSRGPDLDDSAPLDTPGMHIDIHSFSQLVLWPWGQTQTPSPNDAGFVALGNKLAWYNSYTPQQSIGLYPTDGTSDAVSYGELGVAAFTFELGTAFFQQCSDYTYTIKPDNLKALLYAAKATAAPYLLAHGPDLWRIQINGSEQTATVAQGNVAELKLAASTNRTRQTLSGHSVKRVEYSINTPIWKDTAQIHSLNADDNTFDSELETATAQIDTTNLSQGQHTVFVRAINQDDQAGVTSAIDLIVANNNSATPLFTTTCSELTCSFDPSESSDSDGDIIGYTWFYGDGTSASLATDTVHNYTYPQAGNYSVTLSTVDDSQNRSYVSTNIEVTSPSNPQPEPEPESSSGGGSNSLIFLILLTLVLFRKSFNTTKIANKPVNNQF